jgi:[protein-PII] uridylyltransferase
MATRSFLVETEIQQGLEILSPGPEVFPKNAAELRGRFSLWLEQRLLFRLQELGDFQALQPVLVGSWARHELSPKSDIDVLFVGDESLVKEFVAKAFRSGIKLRARTPQDFTDWTVGVEPFDILAVNAAQPWVATQEAQVAEQQRKAFGHRRTVLSAIRQERIERHKRLDSISNYLEPNLKFGGGALRDIIQALAVRDLFPEKFADAEDYPFKVLATIKEELLYLRCLLHLLGSSDILSATDQLEVARRLGMESKQLMKFLQSELERASFYGDWAVANATASTKLRKSSQLPLTSLSQAISRLREEPNLLLQYQVRLKVDNLVKPLSERERGRLLHKAVAGDCADADLLSLYRTRLLEVLIPDLKKLKGLVQHDHYHRFTADAHLVQTLREVQRGQSQRRSLGVLAKLTPDLSAQDWWTLKLTALFHDLAKGRKGDHSSEGALLVDKYFKEWDYPTSLREDVRWLVENHLLISTAAFRQNPQAQSTWKRLFERGVHGRRLILLALFTAIDIRATNPEAWTPWKARLLLDLVENLQSREALSLHQHLKFSGYDAQMQEWLMALDPALLQNLSPRVLSADLRAAKAGALPPKVVRRGGRIWVRFHSRQDETGLFLSMVQRLYGLGLNIQMSSVSTLPEVGVYDWFCLRTEKSAQKIAQWLSWEGRAPAAIPKVEFQSIELMSQEPSEWIFSFRGRDQRGLLLNAAQALVEENLSLRWARVHTWGQQIEDIFSVQPLGEVENTLQRLRNRFVT